MARFAGRSEEEEKERDRREGRGDLSVRSTISMESKLMVSRGKGRRGLLGLDMVDGSGSDARRGMDSDFSNRGLHIQDGSPSLRFHTFVEGKA